MENGYFKSWLAWLSWLAGLAGLVGLAGLAGLAGRKRGQDRGRAKASAGERGRARASAGFCWLAGWLAGAASFSNFLRRN